MSYPQASRQYHYVTAPRAYNATGPNGQVVVAAVSASGSVVDLSLLTFSLPPNLIAAQSSGLLGPGVTNDYITIEADGQDLGIIVGPTLASVTGGSKPVLTTYGALSATGTYQGAAGTCFRVPAGTSVRRIPLPPPANVPGTGNGPTGPNYQNPVFGGDRYLGLCAPSGQTGIARIYQSSPDNP